MERTGIVYTTKSEINSRKVYAYSYYISQKIK